MKQTILSDDGCKEESTIERLYRLRMDYFIELLNEINNLREKRIELIKNYKNEVYSIDLNITREIQKSKSKDNREKL